MEGSAILLRTISSFGPFTKMPPVQFRRSSMTEARTEEMKVLYLDSSILVSLAIRDRLRFSKLTARIQEAEQLISNEIAIVEAQAGLSFGLSDNARELVDAEQNLNQILAALSLTQIDSLTLGHARALVKRYRVSIGLRTLDAIHLASANLVREGFSDTPGFRMTYLTADRKQHAAFTAEGHVGMCLE